MNHDVQSIHDLAGRVIMMGFRGATLESPFSEELVDLGLAGVILFDEDVSAGSHHRNVLSSEQLAALTAQLRTAVPDLLIAIDQEGGHVARLNPRNGHQAFPSAADCAAGGVDSTRTSAELMATALQAGGINVNFAPCVDVNITSENPIIGALGRSYSTDAAAVIDHAGAFVEAHRCRGVACALKHFPGHGSSTADTHLQAVDITRTFQQDELEPYKKMCDMPGVAMVMTGHLRHDGRDAEHPATLSQAWISEVLRNELNYDGVIVTDGMDMAAVAAHYTLEERVALALNAGVDLLLFGNNLVYDPQRPRQVVTAVVSAVTGGRVPLECLKQHANRVDALRAQLVDGAFPPGTPLSPNL